MSDLSREERAIIIRGHLASPGWAMQDQTLAEKLELVKQQAFLMPTERHSDYREWSIDRISGMVLGLGFARALLPLWLEKHEAAERAALEQDREPEPRGHPYGHDPEST